MNLSKYIFCETTQKLNFQLSINTNLLNKAWVPKLSILVTMLKSLDSSNRLKFSSQLKLECKQTTTGHMKLPVATITTMIDKTRLLTGSSTIGIRTNKLKNFTNKFCEGQNNEVTS
jgi:hypothetical protein